MEFSTMLALRMNPDRHKKTQFQSQLYEQYSATEYIMIFSSFIEQ